MADIDFEWPPSDTELYLPEKGARPVFATPMDTFVFLMSTSQYDAARRVFETNGLDAAALAMHRVDIFMALFTNGRSEGVVLIDALLLARGETLAPATCVRALAWAHETGTLATALANPCFAQHWSPEQCFLPRSETPFGDFVDRGDTEMIAKVLDGVACIDDAIVQAAITLALHYALRRPQLQGVVSLLAAYWRPKDDVTRFGVFIAACARNPRSDVVRIGPSARDIRGAIERGDTATLDRVFIRFRYGLGFAADWRESELATDGPCSLCLAVAQRPRNDALIRRVLRLYLT